MSSLYDDFEKRFSSGTFSAGWVEVEIKTPKTEILHKNLSTLEAELAGLNESIEGIMQKQLRLANLAKLYN